MRRTEYCQSNAVAESFFNSLKRELKIKKKIKDRHYTQQVVHDYIEKFYNKIGFILRLAS